MRLPTCVVIELEVGHWIELRLENGDILILARVFSKYFSVECGICRYGYMVSQNTKKPL